MADIKISQLTSAQQITGSEMIPLTSGAATVKATPALIKEYAIGDTDISSIGDGTPTGAIASLESSKADTSDLGTAAAKDSTNAVTQNSTDLVESGAVYTGLAAKANTSDLGTAAAKDSTNAVTQNSTDLIESGAVYTGLAGKANSADLATVATSGSYNDLLNKPTLGTAAAKASTNAVTQNSTDLVESGAVYSSVDALSTALTTVNQTKPTANANIGKGQYFYLDGSLVKTKVTIHSGDTFTLNTNYEATSLGGLNDIIGLFFSNEQFIVSGNGSKTITFGGGANAFLICNGASSSLDGLFIVVSDTSGNASATKLSSSDMGASISFSTGSFTITVSNGSASSLRCSLIVLSGSLTVN